MRSLLTKSEVAGLIGKTVRWVEINSGQFATSAAEQRAVNGRAPILYHLSSLPPEAQAAWVTSQGENLIEIIPAAQSLTGQAVLPLSVVAGGNLSEEDSQVAKYRFSVIEPLVSEQKFRRLVLECGGGGRTAVADALARQHGVTRSTIYSWLKAFNDGGLAALVNRDRSDKGRPRSLNNAALEFILAASLPKQRGYGSLSVREIHRAYMEERAWRQAKIARSLSADDQRKYARYLDVENRLSADALLPEASYATFHRWCSKIPSVLKVMANEGTEAFANTQEIISYRDIASLQPLDYVVMDHRRLDLFCLVKGRDGWKLLRPWLTAAIDMRTRKWLAWVIVETPSSDSIASVLKKTFTVHGIPKAVYWDNGKDFTCEWFEGRERRNGDPFRISELEEGARGVLETLGVRVHHAIVKRARSKIIEPNFLNTSKFDQTLTWWCGHKPTERPERFDDLVEQHDRWIAGDAKETPFRPIEHIAWLYDEFLERDLNEREHSGDGMRKVTVTGHGWMCPNECWEILISKVERRWAPPEVIQFCFRKRREVTVAHSEVKLTFGGKPFHYRLIEDPVKLVSLNGRKVEVAYDPYDLETVALYHDGRFISLASNVELRKMGEQDFVADEQDRRRIRREAKDMLRQIHAAVPIAGAEERAMRRAEVRPLRFEPERALVAAVLPARVTDAVAAQLRAAEPGEPVEVPVIVRPDDSDGGDIFHFFSEGVE